MILRIMTLSITALSIMILSIITLSITTLSVMLVVITTLGIMILGTITLSIMILSTKALSIMTLSILTQDAGYDFSILSRFLLSCWASFSVFIFKMLVFDVILTFLTFRLKLI